MARISIKELYCSESSGAKYGVGGIMGAVMQEVMIHGVPKEYDERTYIELLIIKHTLKAAEQMKTEGDFVSGMTDAESLSCCNRWWPAAGDAVTNGSPAVPAAECKTLFHGALDMSLHRA